MHPGLGLFIPAVAPKFLARIKDRNDVKDQRTASIIIAIVIPLTALPRDERPALANQKVSLIVTRVSGILRAAPEKSPRCIGTITRRIQPARISLLNQKRPSRVHQTQANRGSSRVQSEPCLIGLFDRPRISTRTRWLVIGEIAQERTIKLPGV